MNETTNEATAVVSARRRMRHLARMAAAAVLLTAVGCAADGEAIVQAVGEAGDEAIVQAVGEADDEAPLPTTPALLTRADIEVLVDARVAELLDRAALLTRADIECLVDARVAELLDRAAPPQRRIYVVQPGDTLVRIADGFGVSIQALMEENGKDGTLLSVGDQLIIPPAPPGC